VLLIIVLLIPPVYQERRPHINVLHVVVAILYVKVMLTA